MDVISEAMSGHYADFSAEYVMNHELAFSGANFHCPKLYGNCRRVPRVFVT